MGVYIKDIKMPTENNELRLIIHSNGQVFISHQTYFDETEAIPVQPHGRLIDADALADSFEPSDFWNPDAEDNCFAAVRIVHNAPIIIPASDKDINVLGKEETKT